MLKIHRLNWNKFGGKNMKNLNNFVTHSLGLRLVCGNCFQKCRISNKEAVKLKISTRLATVSMTVDSKSKKSCQKIRENRQKFNGSIEWLFAGVVFVTSCDSQPKFKLISTIRPFKIQEWTGSFIAQKCTEARRVRYCCVGVCACVCVVDHK